MTVGFSRTLDTGDSKGDVVLKKGAERTVLIAHSDHSNARKANRKDDDARSEVKITLKDISLQKRSVLIRADFLFDNRAVNCPRTPEDIPALIQALWEVHVQDAYPSMWPDQPEAFIAPPDTVGAWVAEVDGQTVGQVLLRVVTEPPGWMVDAGLTDPNLLIISRLFVAPSGRKRGLAEALFRTAWAEAEKRGLRAVLDVHHRNHAAIRLYERLEWQRIASVNGNWTEPDGSVPQVHVYVPPS